MATVTFHGDEGWVAHLLSKPRSEESRVRCKRARVAWISDGMYSGDCGFQIHPAGDRRSFRRPVAEP